MNNDDKKQFLALIKGEDISEIMSLLAEYSNQYSRKMLRLSFGYVGSIAYRSSTSSVSTPYILYIGTGTRPTRW